MEYKNLVDVCYNIAKNAHAGQVRKNSGIPYINHPKQVSNLVTEKFGKYIEDLYSYSTVFEVVSAALLHDVLEDTHYNYDSLYRRLQREDIHPIKINSIMTIVDGLTDTSKQEYPFLNRAGRKVADGIRMSKEGQLVQLIKVCDIMCNVSDYVNEDPKYAISYINEKKQYVNFLVNLPEDILNDLKLFLDIKLNEANGKLQ